MAALFRRKKKLPSAKDVIKSLEEYLSATGTPASPDGDSLDELTQTALESLKALICGNDDEEVSPTQAQTEEMILLFLDTPDLLRRIIDSLGSLSFENKKRFAYIYCSFVARDVGGRVAAIEYLLRPENRSLLELLTRNQFVSQLALVSGQMLRATLVSEDIVRVLLSSPTLLLYFDAVRSPEFEIASDAWNSFRSILTFGLTAETESYRRGPMCATDQFLDGSYDEFVPRLLGMLDMSNYIATRQTLNLLAELVQLCSGTWVRRFLGSVSNMQRMLDLLNEDAKSIKLATFQVFKFFPGEQHLTPEVATMLSRNKEQLLAFFNAFLADNESPTFLSDKEIVISLIRGLKDAPPRSKDSSSTSKLAAAAAAAVATPLPDTDASGSGAAGIGRQKQHRKRRAASTEKPPAASAGGGHISDDSSYWISSDE